MLQGQIKINWSDTPVPFKVKGDQLIIGSKPYDEPGLTNLEQCVYACDYHVHVTAYNIGEGWEVYREKGE